MRSDGDEWSDVDENKSKDWWMKDKPNTLYWDNMQKLLALRRPSVSTTRPFAKQDTHYVIQRHHRQTCQQRNQKALEALLLDTQLPVPAHDTFIPACCSPNRTDLNTADLDGSIVLLQYPCLVGHSGEGPISMTKLVAIQVYWPATMTWQQEMRPIPYKWGPILHFSYSKAMTIATYWDNS